MLSKLRQRMTFANVVSVIALFVALGGTSIAAVTLVRNSVKSKHIAANAVTGPKVKNASLRAADFAPGQLPRGEKGDTGAPGSPGIPGSPGAPGSPAASLVMGNTANALQTTQGTSALAPSGASDRSGAEELRTQASPNATIVVSDLAVSQSQPSGADGQYNYRLTNLTPNPDTILLSCSIAGASDRDCDSGSQSATVAPGSRLVFEVNQNGTAPTLSSTFAAWGWRATTP